MINWCSEFEEGKTS